MRINMSFLSCLISHFQSEAKFKTVDVVGSFTDSRLGVYPLCRLGADDFEMSQWPELLILIKVNISLGEGVFWLVCFVAGLWCWSKSQLGWAVQFCSDSVHPCILVSTNTLLTFVQHMEHIPACSAVSLILAGETKAPTSNCTATFQLCQLGSGSEGLTLLAIVAVTAKCQRASLSCGGQHTDIYVLAVSIRQLHTHSKATPVRLPHIHRQD